MELQPADSSLFRSAIESLKDFLPEGQLFITPKGLTISGMDASHVGFVSYTLAAEDCAVLKVPVPLTLGVPLAILSRVLSSASENVTLKSTDTHLIVSCNSDKFKKKSTAEVPLLTIDAESVSIPDQDYTASIQARTADVAAVCKDVAAFGDTLSFMLDEEGFHISSKSEMGSMTQMLENTEDREMTLHSALTRPVLFGTKYITNMLKCGISPTMSLDFTTDTPMRIMYKYGHASSLLFYLAPKIPDEN